MTNSKNTKRALLMSLLSMMLCVAMLIGSTFAWFTDSVTSGKNQIVAGNLDIELEYATAFNADGTITWATVDSETELFKALEKDGVTANLWEPGHTEYVYLRVSNVGTLALNYQFTVNVYGDAEGKTGEKEYTNKDGGKFKLSDSLVFIQKDGASEVADRESLWISDAAAEKKAMGDLSGLGLTSDKMLPGEEKIVTLAVYMPTQVGNEANYKTGTDRPEIYLGLSLKATQAPHENDSFDPNYDANATYVGEVVKYSFENASDAIAFCPDCYNAGTTADHADHAEYLIVEDGVAKVPQTGAWLAFEDLDWKNNAYALNYDVNLEMLDTDAFIAFDAGETTTWKDLHVGFKKTESGIEVYKTLFINQLNETKLLGEIGEKVHITYTFTPKGTDLIMLATVTDGEHTYTVENTVSNFPAGTDLCWDVYTTEGDEDNTYAALDNVVFSVLPYDRVPDLIQEGYAAVETADELTKALADGGKAVLQNDIAKTADASTPYANKAGYILNGGVLDGNDKTLSVSSGDGAMDCYAIMTSGGTVKNLKIDDSFRGIVVMYPTEDIILNNVHIGGENVAYAINTAESKDETVKLIAEDCSFAGWSSFSRIASASFTNCQFKQGSILSKIGYAELYDRLVKPYVNTEFKDCSFSTNYYMDLSSLGAGCMITLDNCTLDDTIITAENCETLFDMVELPKGRTLEDCVIFK